MRATLTLPDPLVAALKQRAAERGISMSALATELLEREMREQSSQSDDRSDR